MGKFYEDLEPGQVYRHRVTRTVTEVDNLMYTVLAHNDQPLHLDTEFSKKTMHGARASNSIYTLAFTCGAGTEELTLGNSLGDVAYEDVRFPNPVRIGDTLRSETTVLEKEESAEHPTAGIVTFQHVGYNQNDQIVVKGKRKELVLKRAHAIV